MNSTFLRRFFRRPAVAHPTRSNSAPTNHRATARTPPPEVDDHVRIVCATISRGLARRGAHSAGANALARTLAVDRWSRLDERTFRRSGADMDPAARSRASCSGRHVVHGRFHIYAAVPLWSRRIHHVDADGVVGCGPRHLAVLDGNAAGDGGPRRLDHRLGSLRFPDGEEHRARRASLAVHAARLVVEALLPARSAVDRVPGAHGLVRDRSDDLHIYAAAHTQ